MRMGERGSATIIHLTLIAATLTILAAILGAASMTAVKSHAGAVADLAALAAAETGTCVAAEQVMARNQKYNLGLIRCQSVGLHAQVQVGRGGILEVSVTSRAGPDW